MLRTAGPDELFALVKRATSLRPEMAEHRGAVLDADSRMTTCCNSRWTRPAPAASLSATLTGLFRSTDSGVTFTKIGAALEKERVRAVAISSEGLVFAGAFGVSLCPTTVGQPGLR